MPPKRTKKGKKKSTPPPATAKEATNGAPRAAASAAPPAAAAASSSDDEFEELCAKKALDIESVVELRRVGDAVLCPGAPRVVLCVTRSFKNEEGVYEKHSHLHITNPLTQLTFGNVQDSCPTGQIHAINIRGGESQRVSNFDVDVDHLLASPHHCRVAFSAKVYLDSESFSDTKARDVARAKSGEDQIVAYDQLMVRAWDEFVSEKRAHVFMAAVEVRGDGRVALAGPPVDVMTGVDGDAPTHTTFGDREEFCFSPCGTRFLYTIKLRNVEMAYSVNTVIADTPAPLRLVSAQSAATDGGGGGERGGTAAAEEEEEEDTLFAYTLANDCMNARPRVSPNGARVLFARSARPQHEADQMRLHVFDRRSGTVAALRLVDVSGAAGGAAADALAAAALSVAEFAWLSDAEIVFLAHRRGRTCVFYATLAESVAEAHCFLVLAQGRLSNLLVRSESADGGSVSLYVLQQRLARPAELALVQFNKEALVRDAAKMGTASGGNKSKKKMCLDYVADAAVCDYVTHFNDEALEGFAFEPRIELFDESRGDLHSLLVFPPPQATRATRDADGKVPLAVVCHGGPQGAWDDSFHYRWNLQLLAAATGCAVLATNFRGSTGYGQAFCDAVSRHWDHAAEDCVAALDYVCERYAARVCAQRVVALGASFGGWCMNWFQSHYGDRFRALVNHDGCFDLTMTHFSTDEHWFDAVEFGAWPEEKALYDRLSPSHYVDAWRVPMLLIHGAKDYRVDITDSLGAFTALQERGVESRLVVFKNENHWVCKAFNSVRWHKEVAQWIHKAVDVREEKQHNVM